MELNSEIIAERLRKLRNGRSPEDAAGALGISQAALRAYESGERIPNDELKLRIAELYGERVERIFFAE